MRVLVRGRQGVGVGERFVGFEDGAEATRQGRQKMPGRAKNKTVP